MKIGTKVQMVNCAEAEIYKNRIWVTRSEPWRLGCGEWVVLLEGYSGGFALKYLTEELHKEIISVKFRSKTNKEEFAGREYSYYTNIPVNVGDIVIVPMKNGEVKAQITRVNINDSEINFDKSLLKTITTLSIEQEESE